MEAVVYPYSHLLLLLLALLVLVYCVCSVILSADIQVTATPVIIQSYQASDEQFFYVSLCPIYEKSTPVITVRYIK